MIAPIVRIDRAKRMVEAIATSEAVDSFHTRFSYAASVDAFKRAFGNVREMHQLIAAGRLVRWQGDPVKKLIRVWIYISEGAESTWKKILDGTLRGISIGADPKQWEQGTDGVRVCVRYDLVELSVVDEPSNPDALVTAIRVWRAKAMADGDELPTEDEQATGDANKVKPTADAWHDIRDTSLGNARAAMTNCGCDECDDLADQLDARKPKATRGKGTAASTTALLAEVRRAMATQQAALIRAIDGKLSCLDDIDARLAIIEAQPFGDVPVSHSNGQVASSAHQRSVALPVGVQPDMSRQAQPQVTRAQQIAALQATAQRTADPGLQVALAAEIQQLQRQA